MSNKRILALIILVIIVAAVWLLGHFIYSDPNRVFDHMISDNFNASSYTKEVVSGNSSAVTDEIMSIQLGSKNRTISEQIETVPSQKVGRVVTLNVGTPTRDYSTFLAIDTQQNGKNGQPLDYSSIIGIWGYSKPSDPSSTTGKLFTRSILGSAFAVGNVNNIQKTELINYINSQKIYTITGKIKRQMFKGRLVYVYPVTIKLQPLAILLQKFAKDLGLNMPPENTNKLANIKEPIIVTVDVLSRQLKSVVYSGSSAQEKYSSFGSKLQVNIPKNAIPLIDLEKKLEVIGTS